MYSLNRLLLIIVIFANVSSFANGLPLPAALYTIDDLVSEFRSPLKTKIEDLKKNYRARTSNNLVEYSSHEKVNCLFRDWEADSVLTRIEYFFRAKGKEGLDVFRYHGCGETLNLVERFLRVGPNQTALSFNEFSRAKLSFKLKKEWERYFYQLQNDKGENLFTLSGRWLNEAKNSALYSFSIRDQEFLSVHYQFLPEETRVTYTFKGYDYKYNYAPYFNSAETINHNTFSFKVLIKKSAPNNPMYLSSRETLLSQNTFVQYFSFWAITRGLGFVKTFVNFHLYWFPPTEFVNTGGQTQRFINELRLNLNRILNSTNINLVEVYFRKLIEAVENGLITDRRPIE